MIITKKIIFLFVSAFFFVGLNSVHAQLNVVTTSQELKWAMEQIGGEDVVVTSLLTGHEDPHYIDAVPSHIQRVSRADIVCAIGMELEEGWLPKVLNRARNPKVLSNADGYCEFGRSLENPIRDHDGNIDRSHGDVHASGNPHFWLGPADLAQAAKSGLNTLIAVNPQRAEYYLKNYQNFKQTLTRIEKRVEAILAQLENRDELQFLEYHKELAYFFRAFGLVSRGALEEVPGVPPSAGRIARVAVDSKEHGVDLLIASTFYPRRHLERFQQISGISFLVHPVMMLDEGEFSDYEHLLVSLASEIVEKIKK